MFIERFNQYLKFEKRFSPHTVGAYQKDLQQFSDYLKNLDLDFASAQHLHITGFIVDLIESQKVEAVSVNRKISSLRTFYKFLNREKLVSTNPMLHVKALKVPKKLPVVVEEEKLNDLLDARDVFSDDFSGLRDRLVIELLFGTGMRLAELLSLKESDIDPWNKSIRVVGKRSKERIIPINSTLHGLIKSYLDQKRSLVKASEFLITTEAGDRGYPKLIYRIVNKYLSYISTRTKKSPHVLRHTFATSLLNRGADLNAIKELLGHVGLAASQVYTHNSVERLKSIYKQAHPKA